MARKWTKDTVWQESMKYSSRSEFKKGSSGAFHIAYINGWLDEMTWLVHPAPKPNKWTKDAVFEESKNIRSLAISTAKMRQHMKLQEKKGGLTK